MLIGLISDTHIPMAAKALPPQIKDAFRNVDLILHAGDILCVSVLDELESLAPVLAAEGDDELLEVVNDKRVKWQHTLTAEGITIWVSHEKIWPWDIHKRRVEWEQTLTAEGAARWLSYKGEWPWDEHQKPPDVFVFGHTHWASVENDGNVLLVSPGSPTFPRYKYELGTVGLLTVSSGKVKAEIVQLR